VVAGIVDTDTYAAHIHFPFFSTGPDGVHIIEKGTPLVQIFPFRRADAAIETEVRAETDEEVSERERVYRRRLVSQVCPSEAMRLPKGRRNFRGQNKLDHQ
jgi:hypothetical protein